MEVSRRSFLQLSVSSLFIVSTGCGGGGGGNETIPDPGRFKAQVDGSVFDNTGRLFGITSIVVPEFNDEKVVAIHYRHQTLLSSDRLVFEVNGERKDGGADSAKRTQVQQGDVIGWKMI